MWQRALVVLIALGLGNAAAQTYVLGTQTGTPTLYSIHFGLEENPSGSTFGTRVSLGLSPWDTSSPLSVRADGYFRLGFSSDTHSGLIIGVSATYLSLSLPMSSSNDVVRFQYLVPGFFIGVQLQVFPKTSLSFEAGLGLPIPLAISAVDLFPGIGGLVFTSVLASIRLHLGFQIYI
jgi:hypothetical protein